MTQKDRGRWNLAGAIVAGVGASACCFGPLILLGLGISGTWIASLTALEPYRPLFIALVAMFLLLAFRRLYRNEKTCDDGQACAIPEVRRRQRFIFWSVGVILLVVLALPDIAPYLLGY
ncbi:mercuric transporter MerT family protein [Acidihalobacter prosperus]|uniref:Mercuric transport protein MerT n=1 Tax=Acidihalobacter prosperus TaxID=160660 RepID=A0A1A6C5D4_9GAMM|nr:mercuric transporter MerT family protein [Acidihalobacter prosperus]OBS09759.1 hypothetical protein Thpro_020809 [Acidihalobacter prosperus]